MRIGYLFGIIIVLFSCKEAPIVVPPPPAEEVVEVDSAPPIIKWISPRFDAVVKEIITIKCQVIDTGGVALVELFIDGLLSGINSNSTSDTTFEFNCTLIGCIYCYLWSLIEVRFKAISTDC